METLTAYDLGALYWFGSLHRPWLNDLVRALTRLGDFTLLGSLSLALILALVFARKGRLAFGFSLLCVLAYLLHWIAKQIVQRPRPDVAWRLIDLPNEPSFPSGHAFCSMAIYTTAGFLLASLTDRPWLRWLLRGAGVSLGLLVGLTRPYLGVHFPLDVVAGWIGGLGCALIAIALILPPPLPR